MSDDDLERAAWFRRQARAVRSELRRIPATGKNADVSVDWVGKEERFLPAEQDWRKSALAAGGDAQASLWASAERVREEVFGKRIFVRGVIEVANFCRQNCSYCGMRRENGALRRFRLAREIVRRVINESLPPSVTDLNFQAGEDPVALKELVLPVIEEIAREKRLGISVCLGTVDHRLYDELRRAGARGYIIKLETGDPEQYRLLQCPGTLEKRLEAIQYLVRTGWCVSSGLILGLPNQTLNQVIATLDLLRSLSLSGCSVSPFIPGEGTPLSSEKAADLDQTLNAVAVLRLSSPRWIVPAVSAMNLCDSSGYVRALRAGANLATINLTPSEWRGDYQLYRRKRWIMTEERVLRAIEQAGCEPSPESWVAASSSFPSLASLLPASRSLP
ncbi:radical SAM protein [Verrucomicrobium sp. 3C]|uniref:radical SAM protein n=1 Tax=Verrucomicrobium sp. 3C TaxID=1134055 RepID=UPI0018CB888F|nr:radical SAM protein [Verrucomicrobium sp. 3C]